MGHYRRAAFAYALCREDMERLLRATGEGASSEGAPSKQGLKGWERWTGGWCGYIQGLLKEREAEEAGAGRQGAGLQGVGIQGASRLEEEVAELYRWALAMAGEEANGWTALRGETIGEAIAAIAAKAAQRKRPESWVTTAAPP